MYIHIFPSITIIQVFAANTAEVLTYHQVSISQTCPKEGWVEQDALEILRAVRECLKQTVFNLRQLTIDPADIVAIGITNQRETTVVWDSVTGEPLYNAIGKLHHYKYYADEIFPICNNLSVINIFAIQYGWI